MQSVFFLVKRLRWKTTRKLKPLRPEVNWVTPLEPGLGAGLTGKPLGDEPQLLWLSWAQSEEATGCHLGSPLARGVNLRMAAVWAGQQAKVGAWVCRFLMSYTGSGTGEGWTLSYSGFAQGGMYQKPLAECLSVGASLRLQVTGGKFSLFFCVYTLNSSSGSEQNLNRLCLNPPYSFQELWPEGHQCLSWL